MENPVKIDDLGVPLFQETIIWEWVKIEVQPQVLFWYLPKSKAGKTTLLGLSLSHTHVGKCGNRTGDYNWDTGG